MRILGIDPGLRATGFGVIDRRDAHCLVYVASGVIRPEGDGLAPRLGKIFSGIQEVIATYAPICAAVELVFVNVNPQSTLLLGQARGAAICGLVASQLVVAEYSATHIKQALVGHGRANKVQVQHMVKRVLNISGDLRADAADALAVAITHAYGVNPAGSCLASAPKRGGRRVHRRWSVIPCE